MSSIRSISSLYKGLILHVPLIDKWLQSSTIASDRSSYRFHSTAQGTPPSFTNDGVVLNGTNDYINCGNSNILSFTDGAGNDKPFSISLWANIDSAYRCTFFSKVSADASSREFSLNTGSTKFLNFAVYTNSSNNLTIQTTSSMESYEGVWVFIVVTYDGSENVSGLNIYFDNEIVTVADISVGSYTGMSNTSENLRIGSYGTLATWYADGKISNFKVHNYELSSVEILQLYKRGR